MNEIEFECLLETSLILQLILPFPSHLYFAHKLPPHDDAKNQKLKNLSDVPFRKENWQHDLLAI